MVLQPTGTLLRHPVAPAFLDCGEFRNQRGFQDSVKVQARISAANFSGYDLQLPHRLQGIRKLLAPHDHRLYPRQRLQEIGMAILHHGLEMRVGKGSAQV